MFRITRRKGFHLPLPNGYTVSVQFGGGNYGDNYDGPISWPVDRECSSMRVEVAVFDADDEMLSDVPIEGSDGMIVGYCDVDKVWEIIDWARSQ